MSEEEKVETPPEEPAIATPTAEQAAGLVGGAFRKRLLAKLAPLPHKASRIRDAIEKSGGDDDLQNALGLDADTFLAPLWTLVEGKMS